MTTTHRVARSASSLWGTALLLQIPSLAAAGWDYRYPKVDDYPHHVYLEQRAFLAVGKQAAGLVNHDVVAGREINAVDVRARSRSARGNHARRHDR